MQAALRCESEDVAAWHSALAASTGWGAAVPPCLPPSLFRISLKFQDGYVVLDPPASAVEDAALSAFDAIFTEGIFDPYARMTLLGRAGDRPMPLPTAETPTYAARRAEVAATVASMLQPLALLARAFELGSADLVSMDVDDHVAAWAQAAHSLEATLSEVARIREARRAAFAVCCLYMRATSHARGDSGRFAVQMEARALERCPGNIVHFQAVTGNVYLVKSTIRSHADAACKGLLRSVTNTLTTSLEGHLATAAELRTRMLTAPDSVGELDCMMKFVDALEGRLDALQDGVAACRQAYERLEAAGVALPERLVERMWKALACVPRLRVRCGAGWVPLACTLARSSALKRACASLCAIHPRA